MNELKRRLWEEMVAQPGRPPALTKKRLKVLEEKLANDAGFWADLLQRHGLADKRLGDLEPSTREHAVGNFWGMVMQAAHEIGMKI
jgi:hypothetical protein